MSNTDGSLDVRIKTKTLFAYSTQITFTTYTEYITLYKYNNGTKIMYLSDVDIPTLSFEGMTWKRDPDYDIHTVVMEE